ncbi:MAG TPA: ribokinase, partial [Paracoccaceae bacterium]|nr:ribokinase [Paracoccaceae bacterium]
MKADRSGVAILGVYVTDLAFRAARQPRMGETLLGSAFAIGPGGKGSNQAVAAARVGAAVTFVTRVGEDAFGRMARELWQREGITARTMPTPTATGAAYIFLDERTGENAIIIYPGAAGEIGPGDIDAAAPDIGAARVFLTQLEQPIPAALRALEIARAAGVTTILNPAPAAPLPDAILPLCDYLTPNESEAAAITGLAVTGPETARRAAEALLSRGARAALITLGEQGALLGTPRECHHVPAYRAGPVVETTGAGDAFNGAFAAA